MKMKRVLFSLCCILTYCTYSQSINELDPVTVTSSITPSAVSKTGRNIIVIKGDAFRNLPVNSIDELLRYLPGVEVQSRGVMGAQSDIIIRGGTFQQVLIILDGIRLNDPLTGHFNSYIPISPSEIDRIEVLKGASSAIYGTEAIGGVINIVTKSFSKKKIANDATAQITAGAFGLINMNIGGTWQDEKNTVSGGIIRNHANGHTQRGIDGFFDATTASVSYSRKISNNIDLSYRTAYDERDFSAQNFYTTFSSDTARENVKTFWNHIKINYNKKNQKISFDAGYKTISDWYQFNPKSVANENKTRQFQSLLVYETNFSDKTSLVAGGQFLQKNIQSNDRGNHSIPQAAVFAMLNQRIGNYIYINPALRYDWSERYGAELVPQLNVSFKKNNYQLRASAGKTIRDADFSERYNNYNKALVSSGRIGNPDLKAEKSFSYEVGGDYWCKGNVKFSATYFQRFQKDLIDWVTTPYNSMPRKDNLAPNGTYALAKNIAEVDINGLETNIQYTKNWSNSSFTTMLGATWINSKSYTAQPSFYLSSQANFLLNYSIEYRWKTISIGVNGLYKRRDDIGSIAQPYLYWNPTYFLMNVKLKTIIKKKLGLFIQVDNVGNTKYSDLLGNIMPSRWWMGGIEFHL